MSVVELLKNSFWMQTLVSHIVCRVPPPIHHNIGKLVALRKAFAYTALEGITGDYLEFGVYEGNSLIAATLAYSGQQLRTYTHVYRDSSPANTRSSTPHCRFFGFDSFQGLQPKDANDPEHPVFTKSNFSTSYHRVLSRVTRASKNQSVELVSGFFSDTATFANLVKLGIKKIRVCLIDCDLGSSTLDALAYTPYFWQPGTVLIFDDYFSYPGDIQAGESGAFRRLCEQHPELRVQEFGQYGFNGKLLIVETPPTFPSSANPIAPAVI